MHFAAIGLALFAAQTARTGERGERSALAPTADPAQPSPRPAIVLDAEAQGEIRERAERTLGREPTADEVASQTELWIDEQVLYREGLERGLERADPLIRERIASRMSYVLEQAVIVPEPSDVQLRAWFSAHADQWTVPARVDFTHVYVAGDDAGAHARIEQLAAVLAAGAAPERLGDRFAGGHRYRGRRVADLARSFGDSFAAGLDTQPAGAWVERTSRLGLHLVRVDRVEAGRSADFAAARADVRKQWRDAYRAAELRVALVRERAGWEIVRP